VEEEKKKKTKKKRLLSLWSFGLNGNSNVKFSVNSNGAPSIPQEEENLI
jgi:hypothetical protein